MLGAIFRAKSHDQLLSLLEWNLHDHFPTITVANFERASILYETDFTNPHIWGDFTLVFGKLPGSYTLHFSSKGNLGCAF